MIGDTCKYHVCVANLDYPPLIKLVNVHPIHLSHGQCEYSPMVQFISVERKNIKNKTKYSRLIQFQNEIHLNSKRITKKIIINK